MDQIENIIQDDEETMESIIEKMKKMDSKKVGNAISTIVYVAIILYAEVHTWNLLSAGINQDYIPIAILGMFALGLTALLMPFAKSHWFTGRQYSFGKWFHWADLGLLFFNTVVDFAFNTGGVLPEWLELYKFYVLPVAPLIIGAGWVMIWELDPDEEERLVLQMQESALRDKFTQKIAKAIDKADITAMVDDAVNSVTPQLVGRFLNAAKKSRGIDAKIIQKDIERIGNNGANFTKR